ncbi:hypothetical protein [Rhizobium rhizoryzae]|uniref:Uncharacterized protein n=1 Tax=Rhizobium rhizoryzae TaxID=451876 RepID=A0A7W6LH52_9HYPH|nr:hypothetical protein [Rhizobium rhizoryzae]MBB4143122.1 hypothetical protein [Rhizobium rhizoryzae]
MNQKTGRQAVSQGKLDGLCGVYSIINGIGLIETRRMSEEDRRHLFVYLVDLLDDGRGIGTIVQSGISFRNLGKLIDVASRLRRSKTRKVVRRQTAMKQIPRDIDEFWDVLGDHVDTAQGRTVILGMSGKYEHWTVVKSISARRMELHDSDGLIQLDKARCGLRDGDGGSHILWATQSYLLYLEDNLDEVL